MMIYSFKVYGPPEPLAFDFLPFLASSSSICPFDSVGEWERTGVFDGGAGVISGESGLGASPFISTFIGASDAVSVAIFVCTGLHISASERHLLGLEDLFAMTNRFCYLVLIT
jgi:hypothetical protein